MPKVYQTYMVELLKNIKSQLNVTSFAYEKGTNADIQFKSYSFIDLVQRFLHKIKLSKIKSNDLKTFNKFDIIHIQHSYLFNKLKFLPKTSSTKTVITIRGADTYLKPWISKQWRDFFKDDHSKIAAFITVSNHQREYLLKWGVPREKTYVIPISFGDKSLFKPKSPNERVLKLVSAFRMTWEKNITDCLKLAKILKRRNIDFTYDIYGDGNDLGQVFYLVEKYNLIENISIHGKISNEEFKSRLVDYDFFLQLSISESLGATVIEAQSRGIPCLISSTDGLPETIVHNKTGYILKNDDLDEFCNTCISLWKNKEKYI
jgi:glycosyltransferase involved in cell wall biosynthesis